MYKCLLKGPDILLYTTKWHITHMDDNQKVMQETV